MANQEDELVTAWNILKASVAFKMAEAEQPGSEKETLLGALGCLGMLTLVFIVLLVIWL